MPLTNPTLLPNLQTEDSSVGTEIATASAVEKNMVVQQTINDLLSADPDLIGLFSPSTMLMDKKTATHAPLENPQQQIISELSSADFDTRDLFLPTANATAPATFVTLNTYRLMMLLFIKAIKQHL